MTSRFRKWLIIVLALLVCLQLRAACAQMPNEEAADVAPGSTTGSELNPIPTIDLLMIQRRFQEQDQEIRQLRDQLGTLQNAVQSPQARLADSVEPLPSSSILQTGANLGAPINPAVFEIAERVPSLEKRLDNAEAGAPESRAYEVGSDMKMAVSWKNGLQFQSANKDFRVHVGGKFQFDISLFDNDPALLVSPAIGGIGPQPDSMNMRRARLRVDGTMYETVDWVVEYDFANFLATAAPTAGQPVISSPGFTEDSITWTSLPYVGNFRAGNTKEPLGFEHLRNDSLLDLLERSYLQDFVFGPFNNGYSPGLMFFNWREDQQGTWAIGFFSSQADNFGYGLGNDYALTGRLTWLPYYDEPTQGAYLWHLGVAASTRAPDEGVVRLRDRGDIRSGPPGILNPIYADTGTVGATDQNIVSAETAVVWGSFSLAGEYVGTWIEGAVQPLTPVPVSRGTPYFQGGYVEASYFLTGEHAVYDRHRAVFDRVIPYENAFCVRTCDGHCKGCGAWQVCARYNAVDLNDNGINGGQLNSFTFGVNWWWNANARVQVNYDFTRRSQVNTVAAGDINALGMRFNWDF